MRTLSVSRFPVLAAALIALAYSPGCRSRTLPPEVLPKDAALRSVNIAGVNGLSGLTRDDRGTLWSVAERVATVVEIPPDRGTARSIAVAGAPADTELESITWLGATATGGARFALGTELDCANNAHVILVGELQGERVQVVDRISLALDLWSATCDPLRGIEGLCWAGTHLIAAIEHAEQDASGIRYAPLARIDLNSGQATPFRLQLTSESGKISALDCRLVEDVIEVLAIERHFEVSRLLRFTVSAAANAAATAGTATAATDAAALITAAIVKDLRPYTRSGTRNLEGLVRLDQGQVDMIVDNQWKDITGPNEIVRLTVSTAP